jgi:cytochrome P450
MHNPKYFPESEKFDPDRWAEESKDGAALDPLIFLPFSAGSHNCIGQVIFFGKN